MASHAPVPSTSDCNRKRKTLDRAPRPLDASDARSWASTYLSLAVAQRLARILCEKCKQPYEPPPAPRDQTAGDRHGRRERETPAHERSRSRAGAQRKVTPQDTPLERGLRQAKRVGLSYAIRTAQLADARVRSGQILVGRLDRSAQRAIAHALRNLIRC